SKQGRRGSDASRARSSRRVREPRMWLHRLIAGWLAVCALCFAGCTEEQLDAPQESSAFVDAGYMRARQLEYLRFATTSFSPGNVVNVMAHLERARVDPPFSVPP